VLVGGGAKLGRRGLSNIPVNSACGRGAKFGRRGLCNISVNSVCGRGSKTWKKKVKQYTCK